MRQAGNVVKPDEIEAVLQYVIKDKQYADLDKLYLVLLPDGTVQQLHTSPESAAEKHQNTRKQFFMWREEQALKLYNLMQNSEHHKVQNCGGWRDIARSVLCSLCTCR